MLPSLKLLVKNFAIFLTKKYLSKENYKNLYQLQYEKANNKTNEKRKRKASRKRQRQQALKYYSMMEN